MGEVEEYTVQVVDREAEEVFARGRRAGGSGFQQLSADSSATVQAMPKKRGSTSGAATDERPYGPTTHAKETSKTSRNTLPEPRQMRNAVSGSLDQFQKRASSSAIPKPEIIRPKTRGPGKPPVETFKVKQLSAAYKEDANRTENKFYKQKR